MRSLRPLPRTFACCAHHVEVAATQALQLGQAHAGRVEQLEDREVAHVDEACPPTRGPRPSETGGRSARGRDSRADTCRAWARRRRARDSCRRSRCDADSDRSCGSPTACAPWSACRVRAWRGAPRKPRIARRSTPCQRPRRAAVVASEEVDELAEVALVGADGVRRDVALFREMVEIVGDSRRGVERERRRSRRHSLRSRLAPRACSSRHSRHVAQARARRICSRLTRLSFTRVRQVVDETEVGVHRLEVLAGSASRR